MRNATLLTAGSWALALLVGCFAWFSPDSPIYPRPAIAAAVVFAAFVLWLVGAIRTGFPKGAPRLSFRAQIGAIAPLLAATVALMLAGRGILAKPAFPLFFILLVGGGLWWWCHQRPGSPTTAAQEAAVALLFIPTILVLLPVLMLAIWGQSLWLLGVPNYGRMIDRYNSVSAVSRYRPVPRAGISADAAGRAVVAIANTGTARREALFIDVPGSSPRGWLPDSGPFAHVTGDTVMQRAIKGFSRVERTWLQQVVDHPGLALVDSVAYAAHLDPWAALKMPLPDGTNAYTLPVPQMVGVRGAARLLLYRAALAMADRRPAVADSLTREVIGYGLRLHDDSDQLLGALIGTMIAREGAATLAELRAATGKPAEADSIRRILAVATVIPFIEHFDSLASRPMGIRAAMIGAVLAHSTPRPVEWDLAGQLGIAPCTDLRELLFGPAPRLQAAYDAVASRVEDSPHAQAAFAAVRRGIVAAVPEGSIPWAFRPTAWALGHANAGACVAVTTMM